MRGKGADVGYTQGLPNLYPKTQTRANSAYIAQSLRYKRRHKYYSGNFFLSKIRSPADAHTYNMITRINGLFRCHKTQTCFGWSIRLDPLPVHLQPDSAPPPSSCPTCGQEQPPAIACRNARFPRGSASVSGECKRVATRDSKLARCSQASLEIQRHENCTRGGRQSHTNL